MKRPGNLYVNPGLDSPVSLITQWQVLRYSSQIKIKLQKSNEPVSSNVTSPEFFFNIYRFDFKRLRSFHKLFIDCARGGCLQIKYTFFQAFKSSGIKVCSSLPSSVYMHACNTGHVTCLFANKRYVAFRRLSLLDDFFRLPNVLPNSIQLGRSRERIVKARVASSIAKTFSKFAELCDPSLVSPGQLQSG